VKPQDFFIGFREFVAILVPGLALLLIFPPIGQELVRRLERALPGHADGATFVFAALLAAYGLGTLLAAGASLLDRPVDNLIAGKGGQGSASLRQAFFLTRASDKLKKTEPYATKLELQVLQDFTNVREDRPWKTKGFWWSYIRLNSPEAIEELDRIEGHQKLFRALAPLALIAGGAAAANLAHAAPILPGLILCWVFLTLYMRARVTFATRLFQLVIVASLPEHALAEAARALRDEAVGNAPLAQDQ
jgi:hypothetical protein